MCGRINAGLDLVGAIPFVGEIADIGKTARTADRIIDGVRATDKLVDGVKVIETVDDTYDAIKTADGIGDTIKAVDATTDAAKAADLTVLSKRDSLLSKTTNPKMKEAINQIYRPKAQIGDGGLGDAIRHELATGELVGGRSHMQKGQERLKNLQNILKSENLNEYEEMVIKDLIDDLQRALKGE